ncbi:MAG: glycosyltransferase [Deltaproteobacteria bacterium]|nr:MAG: glycosyltransferase [Deltaproteobacteria bacterium]
MNTRQDIIQRGLGAVLTHSSSGRVNALEIGCMFRKAEGLSTLEISRFVRKEAVSGRFCSIEYDPEHVQAATELLRELDPAALGFVEFMRGHSLATLPIALERLAEVDFVFLDGGAHPEVCLRELELVLPRLSRRGLIVVDDLQEIAPSAAYPLPRPFGKGTLILPFLVIHEYLRSRELYQDRNNQFSEGRESVPDSELIGAFGNGMDRLLGSLAYRLVTCGGHRMLLIGREELLDTALLTPEVGSAREKPHPHAAIREHTPQFVESDVGRAADPEEDQPAPDMTRPRLSVLALVEDEHQEMDVFMRSLRDQTYRDFELIVLWPGETPSGLKLFTPDPRVRTNVCAEPRPGGLWKALNRGLALATGELVALVNASDVLEPGKLERQITSFDEGDEVDVSFHGRPGVPTVDPGLLQGRSLVSALFEANPVPHGTAVFRREMLRATGVFEPSADPEHQLWLKAAVTGFRFKCIEDELVWSSQPGPAPDSSSVAQVLQSMRNRYTNEDLLPPDSHPHVPDEPAYVACFTSHTEAKTVELELQGYLRSAPPEEGRSFLWLTDSPESTRRFAELYESVCDQINVVPETAPPIDVYQVRQQELLSVFQAQLLWAKGSFSSAGSAALRPFAVESRPRVEQRREAHAFPSLSPIQKERLARRSIPFQGDFLTTCMPELPSVPGIITPEEQRYLYWLTAEGFTGSGAVVEVGTWLGRSTVHLGAGLLVNGYSSHLHCFDKYTWTKAYDAPRLNAGFTLPEGEDFKPYFEKNVRPVYPNVKVTKASLDELEWDGGPIEILLLDAPKSFHEITRALLKFGSHLIPGLSVIVFQHYFHAPSYPIATVVSVIPQLQLLHVVPSSSSAAFAVRGPITFEKPPLEWHYTQWTTDELCSNWKKILDPLSPQPRSFIEPGLCLLLFDLGRKQEAVDYLREISFHREGLERWRFLASVPSYARYKELLRAGP